MIYFLYHVFAITANPKRSDGNHKKFQPEGRRTSNVFNASVAKALFKATLVIDDFTVNEQVLTQRNVCINMLQKYLPSTSDFIWKWYDNEIQYADHALKKYQDNAQFNSMDAVTTIFTYSRINIESHLVDTRFKSCDRISRETPVIPNTPTKIRIRTIPQRQTGSIYTVRTYRKWRAYYVPLHRRSEKSRVDIVITLPDPQQIIIEQFTKTFIVPFSRSTRFNIMLRDSTHQSFTIQDTEPSKGCQELKDMLHNFNLHH
jgi:hypothetical protein